MASVRRDSIDEVKDRIKIVIFGPYDPYKVKSRLVGLKECLIEVGYSECKIVEDIDQPRRRQGENLSEYIVRKSYRWIELADVRVFLFLKGGKNEGVTMELKHMLDHFRDKAELSVVCVEKGKTSQLIAGEIRLHGRLFRINFKNMDDLKEKLIGMLLNFSKQLYYEIKDRER